MSGYIGQERSLGSNPHEIVFMLDPKTGLEKRFECRYHAISHLWLVEHFSRDDLRFIFWYEDGEDKRRELLTGKLIDPVEVEDEEDNV